MFVMVVVMVVPKGFPILTGCGELVRDDCAEGGAVINEQYSDISVLIFQVGEGDMESCSNSI